MAHLLKWGTCLKLVFNLFHCTNIFEHQKLFLNNTKLCPCAFEVQKYVCVLELNCISSVYHLHWLGPLKILHITIGRNVWSVLTYIYIHMDSWNFCLKFECLCCSSIKNYVQVLSAYHCHLHRLLQCLLMLRVLWTCFLCIPLPLQRLQCLSLWWCWKCCGHVFSLPTIAI